MERSILLTMTETVAVLADLVIKQHLKVEALRTAVIGITCTVSSFPELRTPLLNYFEHMLLSEAGQNSATGSSMEMRRLRNEWLAVLMPKEFWEKLRPNA